MKIFFIVAILSLVGGGDQADGKPPITAKPLPTPSPTPAQAAAAVESSANPAVRWFAEQDGSASAISFSWTDVVQTITGRQIAPFKLSDPSDAAFAAKLGGALDSFMPKLNRPDGPIRTAKRLAIIPTLVDDELQTSLAGVVGLASEAADGNRLATLASGASDPYPAFRVTDQTNNQIYYLSVAFQPLDQNDLTRPLVYIDPKTAASRIAANGKCLLVVLEHNNKAGAELAFLNWKIIDLSQGKVRAKASFEAVTGEVILPPAVVGDSRRGRD